MNINQVLITINIHSNYNCNDFEKSTTVLPQVVNRKIKLHKYIYGCLQHPSSSSTSSSTWPFHCFTVSPFTVVFFFKLFLSIVSHITLIIIIIIIVIITKFSLQCFHVWPLLTLADLGWSPATIDSVAICIFYGQCCPFFYSFSSSLPSDDRVHTHHHYIKLCLFHINKSCTMQVECQLTLFHSVFFSIL